MPYEDRFPVSYDEFIENLAIYLKYTDMMKYNYILTCPTLEQFIEMVEQDENITKFEFVVNVKGGISYNDMVQLNYYNFFKDKVFYKNNLMYKVVLNNFNGGALLLDENDDIVIDKYRLSELWKILRNEYETDNGKLSSWKSFNKKMHQW